LIHVMRPTEIWHSVQLLRCDPGLLAGHLLHNGWLTAGEGIFPPRPGSVSSFSHLPL